MISDDAPADLCNLCSNGPADYDPVSGEMVCASCLGDMLDAVE